MCLKKRNEPVRLAKKEETLIEKIKPYMEIELLIVILFIICFIIAIWFAIGETSYYNLHDFAGYILNGG